MFAGRFMLFGETLEPLLNHPLQSIFLGALLLWDTGLWSCDVKGCRCQTLHGNAILAPPSLHRLTHEEVACLSVVSRCSSRERSAFLHPVHAECAMAGSEQSEDGPQNAHALL